MRILLITILFALLLFGGLTVHAQSTAAQSHLELNTRVLKQLVSPVDDEDIVYLTPSGISRSSRLNTVDAISSSYIPLPYDIFPRDIAFDDDGRLFALVSRNIVVDAIILDSLFIVEVIDGAFLDLAQISSERSTIARLSVSSGIAHIYEGRTRSPTGSNLKIAMVHRYDIDNNLLQTRDFLIPNTTREFYFPSENKFHSLQADYSGLYQPLLTGVVIKIDKQTLDAQLLDLRAGDLFPFSYQTVRDTTWGFANDIVSDGLVIFSPSTGIRLQTLQTASPIRDVIANTQGEFVIQSSDTTDYLEFGTIRSSMLERIPFYTANMVELIAISARQNNTSRIAFSMGAEEIDRYFIQGAQFCPSVIRATFLIDYTIKTDIYQPRTTPTIEDITITNVNRNFIRIDRRDSIFSYTAEGNLSFKNFNNESVGVRYSSGDVNQSILRFRRGCNYATIINTENLPIREYYSGGTVPALLAWQLSVDSWPAEPFGEIQVFTLPIFSSVNEVYQSVQNAFPNPTTGLVTLEFDSEQSSEREWTLISTDGRTHAVTPINTSSNAATFSLSGFPVGVYQLTGLNKEGGIRTTVVIEN